VKMRTRNNSKGKSLTKRVFPRVDADQYHKLSIIARKRGQNISSLTRSLYTELIEKEFQNQKPAA